MCSSWRSDPCQPTMEPAVNVLILPAAKTQFAQDEKRTVYRHVDVVVEDPMAQFDALQVQDVQHQVNR